jgi:hypothetical protein
MLKQLIKAIVLEAAFACVYGKDVWYSDTRNDSSLRQIRYDNMAYTGAMVLLEHLTR